MTRNLMAILIALSVAVPVTAAPRDTAPPTDPNVYNRDLARNARATAAMADCIVRGRPVQAREAVTAAYSLAQIRQKTPGLVGRRCMGGDVPGMGLLKGVLYAGDLYLYALAEGVLRMDRTLDRPADFARVPPLVHREPFVDESKFKGREATSILAREREREEAQYFLSRYGECVARNATAETAAVLRTEAGSAQEKAAFVALQPVLGACMKGADQMKLGKAALRGTLALNYYRLAAASTQASDTAGRN